MSNWLCIGVVGLVLAASAFGQGLTGQISGNVQDPAGTVVPNAKVELVSTGTGQTRETNTDGLGNFIFTQLLPGTYAITVTAPGLQEV
jgi:hypothetical protein